MFRYEIRQKNWDDYIIYDNVIRDYIKNNRNKKIIHFTASSAEQWLLDNRIESFQWR